MLILYTHSRLKDKSLETDALFYSTQHNSFKYGNSKRYQE